MLTCCSILLCHPVYRRALKYSDTYTVAYYENI